MYRGHHYRQNGRKHSRKYFVVLVPFGASASKDVSRLAGGAPATKEKSRFYVLLEGRGSPFISKYKYNAAPFHLCRELLEKKLITFLDLCVSSLRRGHANLLCIVPILSDDPRRESAHTHTHTHTHTHIHTHTHTRIQKRQMQKGWQHPEVFPGGPPPQY